MIQIIASDMDGTLLNDEMVISQYNANAIKEAQKQGVHFIVSTGRARGEILPLLKKAGISAPLITINGAQVFDEKGKMISVVAIEDNLAKEIIKTLEERDIYFEVVASKKDKVNVYSDNKAKRIANFAELLSRVTPNTPYKLAVALASARIELMNIAFVKSYDEILLDKDIEILKVVAFSQKGAKVLEPLRRHFSKNPELKITASSDSNIEINQINAQKGFALKAYADSLGIKMQNVMAIGDNNNDISMLEMAGLSYAMANASNEVKKIAKKMTTSNTQDGVGKAIIEVLEQNKMG